MNLFRNLARRKLRTALTISGITIGIWALVVFGSLATKIDSLVSGAHAYFGDRVIVSSEAGGGGMFPLSASLVGLATKVDGVDVAFGEVDTMIDHTSASARASGRDGRSRARFRRRSRRFPVSIRVRPGTHGRR